MKDKKLTLIFVLLLAIAFAFATKALFKVADRHELYGASKYAEKLVWEAENLDVMLTILVENKIEYKSYTRFLTANDRDDYIKRIDRSRIRMRLLLDSLDMAYEQAVSP